MPPPKDAQNLVPETCHNVTFNSNRDFANVMKQFRILSREDDLDCLAGSDAITKVIMRGRQEWQNERRGWEDEGRGHREKEKIEHTTLLTLKMREEDQARRAAGACRGWKRQGSRSLP